NSSEVRLTFSNQDPRSPLELGVSADERRLGFALHTVGLIPLASEGLPVYRLGSSIDFRSGGNAWFYLGGGWGSLEPDATWTIGSRSTLEFQLDRAPATDLLMDVETHAFISAHRPAFDVSALVNDRHLAEWRITRPDTVRRQFVIPQRMLTSSAVRITFINHDPRSPAEVGDLKDNRKLGLAIHTIRLEEASGRGPGSYDRE
ncbi:MAG: hypothetical protein JO022_19450, partial [Acidobacteriaceae bacterium]|nr:hypothetical protein [Acidobacteriaceae bacterium]